jgi:hypothetical protein
MVVSFKNGVEWCDKVDGTKFLSLGRLLSPGMVGGQKISSDFDIALEMLFIFNR